jgi:hypothetical protein
MGKPFHHWNLVELQPVVNHSSEGAASNPDSAIMGHPRKWAIEARGLVLFIGLKGNPPLFQSGVYWGLATIRP